MALRLFSGVATVFKAWVDTMKPPAALAGEQLDEFIRATDPKLLNDYTTYLVAAMQAHAYGHDAEGHYGKMLSQKRVALRDAVAAHFGFNADSPYADREFAESALRGLMASHAMGAGASAAYSISRQISEQETLNETVATIEIRLLQNLGMYLDENRLPALGNVVPRHTQGEPAQYLLAANRSLPAEAITALTASEPKPIATGVVVQQAPINQIERK